jgi:nicotinamidase-related amidase
MSKPFTYHRVDKNDAAVLLVDHQSGLCNIVGDFSPDDFKNNVLACSLMRPTSPALVRSTRGITKTSSKQSKPRAGSS